MKKTDIILLRPHHSNKNEASSEIQKTARKARNKRKVGGAGDEKAGPEDKPLARIGGTPEP